MACPPSCKPQLPPVIEIGAGALQDPFSVRQVATPLPWFPPKPTAILIIDGITAMHFAFFITLSGMALSFTAIISSRTLADASIRLAMSDCSLSSADQLTPAKMPSTRRHFGTVEKTRFILSSSVLELSTHQWTARISYLATGARSIRGRQ